jgi:hypothetical protein
MLRRDAALVADVPEMVDRTPSPNRPPEPIAFRS